jgi:hypothetical protein
MPIRNFPDRTILPPPNPQIHFGGYFNQPCLPDQDLANIGSPA